MTPAEKRFDEIGVAGGKPITNAIAVIDNLNHAMFRAWVRSPRCRRCRWPHESVAFSLDLCDFCQRHVERPK